MLLAFPAASHAAFPGQNGKIAFYNGASGTPGVWTMNPDGTGQAFLRAGGGPAWSPDGRALLFTRESDVRRMPADGSSEVVLRNGNFNGLQGNIYYDPAWAPDGRQFVSAHEDLLETDNPAYYVEVNHGVVVGSGDSPTWRPDGAEIAYSDFARASFNSSGGISGVQPDGTGRHIIWEEYDDDDFAIPTSGGDYSPDGSKIAFEAGGDIYVVPATGGTPVQLTNSSAADTSPAWSPDGAKIAFDSFRDGNREVYVMNADGTNETNVTQDPGTQGDPSWQPILPGYPRPKTASPTRVSLVPAYAPCTAPNRQHGPPLAFGSCTPPTEQSANLTVGPGMSGFVRFQSLLGNPATPADEADIALRVQIADVRVQGTLADYAGEVEGHSTVRLTDRVTPGPATTIDVFFPLLTQCTPTADTSVGSTCSLNTTLDALVPDAIAEGERTVLQLSQVQVYDGGADGDTATQPNSVFLRQGVFVP